jgi:hypothetical protein
MKKGQRQRPLFIVNDSGAVADMFYSVATNKKNTQRTLNILRHMLEQPKLVVRLLTVEERKLVLHLKESRGWDPDILALVGILEALEPRWTEAMNTINVLDEAETLFRKAYISAIHFDVFDSGKVGVCRRTGLFGSGVTLREAFRHVQIVDDKSLRTDEKDRGG